jgi:putative peptidoglycan lipid II flippase
VVIPPGSLDETVVISPIPAVGPAPGTPPPGPVPRAGQPAPSQSLGRASRTMAIASAASRLTGFLRSLAITAAIGVALVGNAYNTANTLPNIVYELLLGGVLTSVVVPLLVQAQERDPDRGEAYTQRLLSLAVAGLAAATLLATLAAPLLTLLYSSGAGAKSELTTFFAYLLLPEIFFYGLGAMIGAVLNTRGVFGPPAWAPVLNNVVVIIVAGLFIGLTAGDGGTTTSLSTGETLLLGIGTTLGIVLQAVVLLPALRRTGFRWRFRLDLRGSRIGEAGPLALWVIGYVVVSQVGYLVQLRLANGVPDELPGVATFTNASLLFQMPYGILGVSLLTALMPRMSRAAARGDQDSLLSDLSLGSRLSALALLPVTALFIVLGPAIGTVIYGHGRTDDGAARTIGTVLALSAFGLVPFAITMLQLRVFYAVKDAHPDHGQPRHDRRPGGAVAGRGAAAAGPAPRRRPAGRDQLVVPGRRGRRRGAAAAPVRPAGHRPDRTGVGAVPGHVRARRAGRLAGAGARLRRARPRLRRLAGRRGGRLGRGRWCARPHGPGRPVRRARRRAARPARAPGHGRIGEAPCRTRVRRQARSPAEVTR